MTISPSGPSTGTAGETFTLECLADIMTQSDSPSPNFEWFFGPTNTSLPSGMTVSDVTVSGNTYTSTLQFSPLGESHAGMYTCRLGGNARLAVNTMITVNGITHYLCFLSFTKLSLPAPSLSVQITTNGALVLGQSSRNSLVCDVSGAENLNPTITYQWTKNNGTQVQLETTSETLSFFHLKLSDAGRYTCQATVRSSYLSRDITMMDSYDVRIQSEFES